MNFNLSIVNVQVRSDQVRLLSDSRGRVWLTSKAGGLMVMDAGSCPLIRGLFSYVDSLTTSRMFLTGGKVELKTGPEYLLMSSWVSGKMVVVVGAKPDDLTFLNHIKAPVVYGGDADPLDRVGEFLDVDDSYTVSNRTLILTN
jgi:hypothetical protein